MKLMIVDDEKYVVEYIKNIINWSKYGFESVRTFHNSIEAKEALIKEQPHLLLSDIRMPEVSGIDLLESVFQHKLETRVIFLSGHSEFEYAQKAIRYGAHDYLLKPIEKSQLEDAVLSVISEIEIDKLEYTIDKKDKELPEEFFTSLESVLFMLLKLSSKPTIEHTIWNLLTNESYKFYRAPINRKNLKIFDDSSDSKTVMDFYLMGYQWKKAHYLIGLIPAYAENSFFEMKPYENLELSDNFSLKNREEMVDIYELFFSETLVHPKNSSYSFEGTAHQVSDEADSLSFEESLEEQKAQVIIDTIHDYIEGNLSERLSLESISKIAYFHPSYLSRFYKKETGEKLSEYILKRRLTRAKKLLRESNLRVADIGKLVGYQKPQYFIKIFKIHFGVTPNHYRIRILEKEV